MRTVEIGRSGISVPDMCLGTMTFGNQTPEADAHRQMDMAVEAGVTFWNCAEMYPVNPVRKETAGRSEAILGSWLASRKGVRGKLVLATKAAGSGNVRPGGYAKGGVKDACEGSLRRLGVEVIDLYQLHWPERPHYSWRRNWTWRPDGDSQGALAGMDEVLGQLGDLVSEGKVRAVGLSNETAWGVLSWRERAEATGGPRMEAVQNEYSLMHRLADADLAEVLAMESVAMLAYSPLAAGLLTGKYQGGATPPGSRKSINGDVGGRITPRAEAAVAAYHRIAAEAGMDPVHMALAWHRTRPFLSIPIFGATTAGQLGRILGGLDAEVSPDLTKRIDEANRAHPLPF